MRKTILSLIAISTLTLGLNAQNFKSVADIHTEKQKYQFVLDVEAAMARAQAKNGVIPQFAADEITKYANMKYLPLDEFHKEYKKVKHRTVAMINTWTSHFENAKAKEYVHFGATTVDIYDTVKVMQIKESVLLYIKYMQTIEDNLIELAEKYKDTPMIGRTLGQHALPITFGKKISTFIGENRRNIERLKVLLKRVDKSAILKGAVGSYLGLGDKAIQVEEDFSKELGFGKPYASDWHPARDIIADYSSKIALISKSYARFGNEIWLLQMTDIGEVNEIRKKTAVGSSTMPHKKNPSKPGALIQHSRELTSGSLAILDDVNNTFERDVTGRMNKYVEKFSVTAEKMFKDMRTLSSKIAVHPDVMMKNINKTNGLIMSQRFVFALAPKIGKVTANDLMHEIALEVYNKNIPLKQALLNNDITKKYLSVKTIDELLDPKTYVGLASQQVDRVVENARTLRQTDPK